jgi:hypothetical protein
MVWRVACFVVIFVVAVALTGSADAAVKGSELITIIGIIGGTKNCGTCPGMKDLDTLK